MRFRQYVLFKCRCKHYVFGLLMTWLNSGGQRSRSQQAIELTKASTPMLGHRILSSNLLHSYQGRIKASAGPGTVPNAGPLQTYNQLTTPTNCGPPKLRAPVLQHP